MIQTHWEVLFWEENSALRAAIFLEVKFVGNFKSLKNTVENRSSMEWIKSRESFLHSEKMNFHHSILGSRSIYSSRGLEWGSVFFKVSKKYLKKNSALRKKCKKNQHRFLGKYWIISIKWIVTFLSALDELMDNSKNWARSQFEDNAGTLACLTWSIPLSWLHYLITFLSDSEWWDYRSWLFELLQQHRHRAWRRDRFFSPSTGTKATSGQ